MSVPQFYFGAGQRQADAACVFGNVERVYAYAGAGFGESVGINDGQPDELIPLVGNSLLGCHAAAKRELPRGKIHSFKLGLVQQPAIKRVQSDKYGYAVFLKFGDKTVQIARVGNQNAFCASFEKQQQVYGQGEDVVKGQGGNYHFFAAFQLVFNPFATLHHIGADIAVREHCTFGDTCCAARVLQKCQIVACQLHRCERMRRSLF